MPENVDQRALLHLRLDQAIDARERDLKAALEQLEEERRAGHEWIESAPEGILLALHSGAASFVGEPSKSRMGGSESRVQLYEPIKKIIESIDPQHMITSVIIHDALLQRIPELEKEDQRKLKARIAATLGRLVDEKLLKIARQGGGSAPHRYKIIGSPYKSVMDALNEGAKIHK
jgi:hypothetical protein